MSTNAIAEGNVIDYTAGADISSGDVVVLTGRIGVALQDIANGDTGPVAVKGVFSIPKASAAVIAQGESVYWDASASNVDDDQATPASGDFLCGMAYAAAGNGETVCQVAINEHQGAVT